MTNNEIIIDESKKTRRRTICLWVLAVYTVYVLLTGGGLNYGGGFSEEQFQQSFEILYGITCSFALYNNEYKTAIFIPTLLHAANYQKRGLTVLLRKPSNQNVTIKLDKIVIGDPVSGRTFFLENRTLTISNSNDRTFAHIHLDGIITGNESIVQIRLYGHIEENENYSRHYFTVDCTIKSTWGWQIIPGWWGLIHAEIPPSIHGNVDY